jgi:hypothetical protein
VYAGTLQVSGYIIIVRFEKQKCSLLKDIYVTPPPPSPAKIIELEQEDGRRYRFAESRIRVGSLKGHGFLKVTEIVITHTVINEN